MSVRKSNRKSNVKKKPAADVKMRVNPRTNASGDSKSIKETERLNPKIKTEAIILTVLALSVLLMLSIFTESAGTLGGYVERLFFSLFGVGACVMPFAIMLGCVFAGFKKFRRTSFLKNILICLLFMSFISIFHVTYQNNNTIITSGPFEYLTYFAKNGGIKNGGLFGALVGGPLVKTVGSTGAYVALVSLAIICVVIITERSVFELLSSAAEKTKNTAIKLNDERIKRFSRREFEPVSKKAGGSSFNEFKRKISSSGQSYNHKLKWGEVDEYENMSYEQKKSFVEDNPELFGFASENETAYYGQSELAETPEGLAEEVSEELLIQEAQNINDISEDLEVEIPEAPEALSADVIKSDIIIENYEDTDNADFYEDKPPFEAAIYEAAVKPHRHTQLEHQQSQITQTSVSNDFIDYSFPPLELLHRGENGNTRDTRSLMLKNAQKLEDTLKSFGVMAKVVQINKGPTVTRYELTPDSGVKVSRIVGLADDIALNLASDGIRIEAPVPGKSVVGIEVPNKDRTPVYLREVLDSAEFRNFESKVAFGVGKDIGGSSIIADISDMPHLLIAGATGAGKSVCINTLITSILYKASPNEVKLILIDPKVVELGVYDGIPHLLLPVVTDAAKAASALNWAVHQMNDRYRLFKEENVRDLKGYNGSKAEKFEFDAILPKIVIIIDELSDLMMTAPKDVEDSIMRLAQKARAAGLHLVLATQRPSVDVITGVIKANIPSRLAFAVSSGTDSRTILDMVGAEKLLGKGDMLFSPRDLAKPVRIQGAFISDKEVEGIVGFIKQHTKAEYDEEIIAEITTAVKAPQGGASGDDGGDELYEEVLEFVLTKKEVSVSMLQRQFRIGYNRAARLMDTLENNAIVSENTAEGTGKPSRKVLANYVE